MDVGKISRISSDALAPVRGAEARKRNITLYQYDYVTFTLVLYKVQTLPYYGLGFYLYWEMIEIAAQTAR